LSESASDTTGLDPKQEADPEGVAELASLQDASRVWGITGGIASCGRSTTGYGSCKPSACPELWYEKAIAAFSGWRENRLQLRQRCDKEITASQSCLFRALMGVLDCARVVG
jgi:hypothetical protein